MGTNHEIISLDPRVSVRDRHRRNNVEEAHSYVARCLSSHSMGVQEYAFDYRWLVRAKNADRAHTRTILMSLLVLRTLAAM